MYKLKWLFSFLLFLIVLLPIKFSEATRSGAKIQGAGSSTNSVELEGTNQGQNIFIINPYLVSDNAYCVEKVILNDRIIMTDPQQKKFGVLVSSLEPGQYLFIRIMHRKGCKPRIENPKVVLSKSTYELVSHKLDEQKLRWTTKNERNQEPYYVEKLKFNKWVTINKIIGQGTEGFNNYSTEINHHSGINKYRLKQRDVEKHFVYSEMFTYESQKEPVTFYPARADRTITFSEETEFEIYNDHGMLIKKGVAKEVDVSEYVPGVYYLNIDNRTEKFLKK